MLSRFLIVWHIIEAALWAGVALWLMDARGWPSVAAIAMVIAGGFLGLRLGLNGLSFVIASVCSPPRPEAFRVNPFAWIAAIVREGWVFTAAYAWYQLRPTHFGREPGIAAVPAAAGERVERPIVLLVHGYVCNGGVWVHYVRWFEAAGYRVFTLSQEPIFGDLDAISHALQARVDELVALFPGAPIHLVCHSMGGLVARAYVRRCGRSQLGKVITLGTPHQGTVLARLGLGENARQMRRNSAWMLDAANRPSLGEAFAVFTYDDNLVSPRANATLPGVAVEPLCGIGHLSLTASRAVFDLVRAKLEC